MIFSSVSAQSDKHVLIMGSVRGPMLDTSNTNLYVTALALCHAGEETNIKKGDVGRL